VRTKPDTLGGVPVVDIELTGAPPAERVILYFHGGAYALGNAASAAGLAAALPGGTCPHDIGREPIARWRRPTPPSFIQVPVGLARVRSTCPGVGSR
jgi:hypothetical protein